MSKAFQLTLYLFLGLISLSAQTENKPLVSPVSASNWLSGGAYSPSENLQSSAPLAYPNVDKAAVFWKKHIWRVVDIHEKINLPFSHLQNGLLTKKPMQK